MSRPPFVFGAGRDLAAAVETHLFGIAPNHSGSTFLWQAVATCRHVWNLGRESRWMRGFAGPRLRWDPEPGRSAPRLIWAADRRWVGVLTNTEAYDWPLICKAWYFQAYARDPAASVFYTKSSANLVIVDELVRHFRNAKFLFMVRNPYAVCEGICREHEHRRPPGVAPLTALFPGRSLPELAATHVVNCLAWQRRNVEAHGGRGIFFTYEAMCAEPERVARKIRALVPALDDLNLRQRLNVKGIYDEMLTDMNARQIARLDAGEVAAFNRVFRRHREVLAYFGYDLMEAPAGRNGAAPA